MPLLLDKAPVAARAADVSPLPIKRLGVLKELRRRHGEPVFRVPTETDELARVLAAPQRVLPSAERIEAWRDKWTSALSRHPGPCACPITRLNGPQAWALEEASQGEYGLLGSLKIGSGKTGLDVLLAMVIPGVKQAVLLIPPNLRAQFAADFARWATHFRVPNLAGAAGVRYPDRPVLRVLAYSELSNASATTWFASYKPDLVIADECQALQDRKSVRTHRFIRHFGDMPGTIFVGYSGSLTTRSIRQYAHLSALALRERSPLPIDPHVTEEWAGVLDPEPMSGFQAPAGALRKLCIDDEDPKEAFRRRMNCTPGVITTEDSRLSVGVRIEVRDPGPLPQVVREALFTVRNKGTRPDGQELEEASEVAAYARQVATGMFTRWKFPQLRGLEGAELEREENRIGEWFVRRKAWNAELRDRMLIRTEHMDSPELCTNAAKRALEGYRGKLPVWHSETWAAWAEVKDTVRHEDDVVWLDDFLIKDASAWAAEAPGIVWVDHPGFGHLLARRSGMPYFGAGDKAGIELLKEDGSRSIIASIKAHGTGKNLQAFNRALMIDTPSDAGIVEQLIGRLYRQGQKRDVTIARYEHTTEYEQAFTSVVRNAKYVRATTGTVHVVLFAD